MTSSLKKRPVWPLFVETTAASFTISVPKSLKALMCTIWWLGTLKSVSDDYLLWLAFMCRCCKSCHLMSDKLVSHCDIENGWIKEDRVSKQIDHEEAGQNYSSYQ